MSNDFPPDGYRGQAAARPATGGPRAARIPGGAYGILHIIGGNDRGKQHQLTGAETAIGRGADQDVVLADIAVSRRHVVIAIDGERYRLKDLGSGNGTLINGVRSDSVLLNDGDQIEIGNTVLRIEHAPSRLGAAMGAPVPQAGADNKTMMGDAVSYGLPMSQPPPQQQMQPMQQQGYGPPPGQNNSYAQMPAPMQQQQMQPTGMGMQPMGGMGSMQQMPPIAQPNPMRPPEPSLPPPIQTGSHDRPSGGLLDTMAKKVAVFGALALILLLGGALVAKKLGVFGGNDGQKFFAEGAKSFAASDYPTAKSMFASALAADPEMAEARKFIKQCDVEMHARKQLEVANGLAGQKKWDEVMKALSTIDKKSAVASDADDLRNKAIPNVVDGLYAQAKDIYKDKPEEARELTDQILFLQPDNADALELQKQIKATAGDNPPTADTKPTHEPHVVAVRTPRPTKPNPNAFAPLPDDDAPPTKPIKGQHTVAVVDSKSPAGGPSDVMTSKGAGPYKAKDFSGAASALRSQGKGGEALATQVSQLAAVYFKAEGDKGKNPSSAVSEYQQAMAIDAKIGKGTHGAYFRSQLGALYGKVAQQSFAATKYDVAFDAVKNAQKYGGSDGGIMGQLKAKAALLNVQASGMAKSNVNGAKAVWRTIVRMVPPDDPNFAKATAGLKASEKTSAPKDEDE